MYELKIAKGVEFLNELASKGVISETWCWEINLLRLDMMNGDMCVLGQLFREAAYAASDAGEPYLHGYDFVSSEHFNNNESELFAMGFNLKWPNQHYSDLRDEWIQEIVRLRKMQP